MRKNENIFSEKKMAAHEKGNLIGCFEAAVSAVVEGVWSKENL